MKDFYLEEPCTTKQGIVGVVRDVGWNIRVYVCSENLPEYSFRHCSIEITLRGVQTVHIVVAGLPELPPHHPSSTGDVQDLDIALQAQSDELLAQGLYLHLHHELHCISLSGKQDGLSFVCLFLYLHFIQ